MEEYNAEVKRHIRQLINREKCYIRFINTTNKAVEISSSDFFRTHVQGMRLQYKGDYDDMKTYNTQRWIAKDWMTKDRLKINGGDFYFPKTTRLQQRFPKRQAPENHEAHTRAYISNPLYSLHYACLLTIRNHMLNEEDVDQLFLPKCLNEELKRAITERNERLMPVLSRLSFIDMGEVRLGQV